MVDKLVYQQKQKRSSWLIWFCDYLLFGQPNQLEFFNDWFLIKAQNYVAIIYNQ